MYKKSLLLTLSALFMLSACSKPAEQETVSPQVQSRYAVRIRPGGIY
jgi:uncharacterized lipoprotein YajG